MKHLFYLALIMFLTGCNTTGKYYYRNKSEEKVKRLESILFAIEEDFTTDINVDDSSRYFKFINLPMVKDLKNDKDFIDMYYSPLILNQANSDFSFGISNPNFNYKDVVMNTRGRVTYNEYKGSTQNWGDYTVETKANRFLDVRDNKERGLLEVKIRIRNVTVLRAYYVL